jgi:SPP1 family predicted phage head-tail adaptor
MSRVIEAGMLRERVEFFAPTTTEDAVGGRATSWESAGDRWAFAEALSGSETTEAQQRITPVTWRIILRRDETLHARMRCRLREQWLHLEWIASYGTDHVFSECRARAGEVWS